MRRAIFATTVLAALVLVAPANAAEAFVSVLEDLPLMEGLSEVEGTALSFDTPQGRFVEAYAQGDRGPAAVRNYYAATLPQLGWDRVSSGVFAREDEFLHVDVFGAQAPVTVRFTVAPR